MVRFVYIFSMCVFVFQVYKMGGLRERSMSCNKNKMRLSFSYMVLMFCSSKLKEYGRGCLLLMLLCVSYVCRMKKKEPNHIGDTRGACTGLESCKCKLIMTDCVLNSGPKIKASMRR